MPADSTLVELLPDVETLKEWLGSREASSGLQARVALDIGARSSQGGSSPALISVFGSGLRAIENIRQGDSADTLSPEESEGLEALVVMVGRPAIQIEGGQFASPVPPGWEVLEQHRSTIERVCRSVGRIDLQGHMFYPWAGTGFLVAPDVVMTNRHVAKAFTNLAGDGTWVFEPGVDACIDYSEAPDVDPPVALEITGVVGVHDDLDMALLRVTPGPGTSGVLPEPLVLATAAPESDQRRPVYTVGYPAHDPRNDPAVMQQIFGDVYGVKRLQPGMSGEVFADRRIIRHDCSTLGGNSGSCVVDLLSGEVLGLHFRGFYMKYNEAVALGCLVDDPLLQAAGVRWAEHPDARLTSATAFRNSRFRVD
jgi:hypothetical protein